MGVTHRESRKADSQGYLCPGRVAGDTRLFHSWVATENVTLLVLVLVLTVSVCMVRSSDSYTIMN